MPSLELAIRVVLVQTIGMILIIKLLKIAENYEKK